MLDWTAIGSIATFLAFVLAFVAIVKENRERSENSRRYQAEHVSAWIDVRPYDDCESPRGTIVVVHNGSPQPVYRGIVWLVRLQGGGGPASGEDMARWIRGSSADDAWERYRPELLSVLPPGRFVVCLPDWEGGMSAVPGIEIAFTDSGGRHWIRRAEGRLEKIDKEPAVRYGIGLPQGWAIPRQVPE